MYIILHFLRYCSLASQGNVQEGNLQASLSITAACEQRQLPVRAAPHASAHGSLLGCDAWIEGGNSSNRSAGPNPLVPTDLQQVPLSLCTHCTRCLLHRVCKDDTDNTAAGPTRPWMCADAWQENCLVLTGVACGQLLYPLRLCLRLCLWKVPHPRVTR